MHSVNHVIPLNAPFFKLQPFFRRKDDALEEMAHKIKFFPSPSSSGLENLLLNLHSTFPFLLLAKASTQEKQIICFVSFSFLVTAENSSRACLAREINR